MRFNRVLVFAALFFGIFPGVLPKAARAESWFYVVVDARVHRADTEISDEQPQERRFYFSNVVQLPDDMRLYEIPKKASAHFTDNVVSEAAGRGVAVDFYDSDMTINGGSVLDMSSRQQAEAARAKEIEHIKERGGNIFGYKFSLDNATFNQPNLIYRDKANPNYDEAATAKTPDATPAPAKISAPVLAVPTSPQILKSTLVIRADRMMRYWKAPNTDNYWSWVPEGRFSVLGPIPVGTKFVVDFTKPDGSLWTSVDCLVDSAAPNEVRNVGIAGAYGHMDKRATTAAGTYGFRIRTVNEATGAKAQLMSGKFTVARFHKGNALPVFKNQFEYWVNQDWQLPIGYLWTNWLGEPQAPSLHVNLWIKNASEDNTKIAAYVFYKGKQIGSTKTDGSAGTISSILTNASDQKDPLYYLWDFTFGTIRAWNTDTGSQFTAHWLDKNPGDYEIKVLYNGTLIRTAKFTVGADGKIVDNGIAVKNKNRRHCDDFAGSRPRHSRRHLERASLESTSFLRQSADRFRRAVNDLSA